MCAAFFDRVVGAIRSWMGYAVGAIAGRFVDDVVITDGEIEGVMADLLYMDAPSAGKTVLADWARQHADRLGKRYTSELARRRDRRVAYASN